MREGHNIVVEILAGTGIEVSDQHYQDAAANIVDTAAKVIQTAEMLITVKEPRPGEQAQLHEGQIQLTCLSLKKRRFSRQLKTVRWRS